MVCNSAKQYFAKKLQLKVKNHGASEPKVQALMPTWGVAEYFLG